MDGKRRIVWAVDPFGTDRAIVESCASAIRLVGSRGSVELVHVIVPTEADRILSMRDPLFLDRYAAEVRARLDGIARKARLPGRVGAAVIVCPDSSRRAAMDALIRFARKFGADLIVAGTHARTGPARWVLGSFVEGLIARSSVPVLIAGKGRRFASAVREIVFVTDFSPGSRRVFEEFLRTLRPKGARIVLFHHVAKPEDPMTATDLVPAAGYGPAFRKWFADEVREKSAKAGEWSLIARKAGASAQLVIAQSAEGIASEAAGYARKAKAALLALATESGPVSAAVLGSVARQAIHRADCPVWVGRAGGSGRARRPARSSHKTLPFVRPTVIV